MAGLAFLAAVASLGQDGPAKWLQEFEKKFPAVEENATADELVRLSLALGLDPLGQSGDARPTREDAEAYQHAAIGTWLETQLSKSGDTIAAPSPRLAEYLEKRQTALWRVVALLQRDAPEWDFDFFGEPSQRPDLPKCFLALSLGRVLVAGALVEERAGHLPQAGDLLEASWTLYRSVSRQPDLSFHLVSASLAKLQAAALRKMSAPGVEWLDRMSSDEPWSQLLESIQSIPLRHRPDGSDTAYASYHDAWVRGWHAVADQLRGRSACDVSQLSAEEIWKPARDEIERWKKAGGDPILDVLQEMSMPNIASYLARAARLAVDRELTSKILELRLEKTASRTGGWPDMLSAPESRACPGVLYVYRADSSWMRVRFGGVVADPATGLLIPLSFEARASKPSPTRTPTHQATPTPTPAASLTPGKPGA